MVHIRTIKTMHGKRYAVVDLFTHYPTTVDKYGKSHVSKAQEYLVVDYKSGKETVPAIFNLNKEGLADAKEVQKLYKKK